MCSSGPCTAPRRAAGAGGFTLTEALIALGVMAVLLGIGVPRMADWLRASRAAAATGFYKEGFDLARSQALVHNSASRIVMSANPGNGQMDWRVDICFPTPSVPCGAASGSWSTTTGPAAGDPGGAAGFRSVQRGADGLPAASVLAQTLSPLGATAVYFTSLGWVDTTVSPRLTRIVLAPATGLAGAFPTSAVVLTLAGIATRCDPNAPAHDSRRCPP